MKRIVWRCDQVLLAHWKADDEAQKRKRALEDANKARAGLGGRQ